MLGHLKKGQAINIRRFRDQIIKIKNFRDKNDKIKNFRDQTIIFKNLKNQTIIFKNYRDQKYNYLNFMNIPSQAAQSMALLTKGSNFQRCGVVVVVFLAPTLYQWTRLDQWNPVVCSKYNSKQL